MRCLHQVYWVEFSLVVGYTVLNIFRFAVKRNICMGMRYGGCRRKACVLNTWPAWLCVDHTAIRSCALLALYFEFVYVKFRCARKRNVTLTTSQKILRWHFFSFWGLLNVLIFMYSDVFSIVFSHGRSYFVKAGNLLPGTQFKEGNLMPALGGIFASKAGV